MPAWSCQDILDKIRLDVDIGSAQGYVVAAKFLQSVEGNERFTKYGIVV